MKEKLYFEKQSSPIGSLYIVFSGKELSGLATERPVGIKAGKAPDSFKRQLNSYFSGSLREFNQDIVFLGGTEFEKKVWLLLRKVPYGETRTYKWLSEQVGLPGGQRAVGQALAKNPIPIVLPCHRIIESRGRIGGYSKGVDIKRRLLEMEYYYSFKKWNS